MYAPKVYVADLAAYNNRILHGVWIDATADLETIQNQIKGMLAHSPVEDAEEYAIHDFEDYGGYRLGEYEGLQAAHEIACFIDAHGDLGADLLSHFCGDMQSAFSAMEGKRLVNHPLNY